MLAESSKTKTICSNSKTSEDKKKKKNVQIKIFKKQIDASTQ